MEITTLTSIEQEFGITDRSIMYAYILICQFWGVARIYWGQLQMSRGYDDGLFKFNSGIGIWVTPLMVIMTFPILLGIEHSTMGITYRIFLYPIMFACFIWVLTKLAKGVSILCERSEGTLGSILWLGVGVSPYVVGFSYISLEIDIGFLSNITTPIVCLQALVISGFFWIISEVAKANIFERTES